ncbi:MAG: sialidase family protein [Bacillota bacterium]|nr:sialidase family protein [Bacillota bacterium]
MRQQTLFHQGMAGYAFFRIPALIALPGRRVIAFCEGRRDSMADYGAIHVVMRASGDGGATFGPLQVVADAKEHTMGNPCPVFDKNTSRLHLLFNGNRKDGGEGLILQGRAPRSVLHMFSDDLGQTWSNPRDITAQVKKDNWTWYACGPCHGAQLNGGRLIIPCNHAVLKTGEAASGPYISHAIYSDDGGQTWQIGGDVGEYTNECALGELPDGRVYINMRSYHGKSCRAAALSKDQGQTWQGLHLDEALIEPVCQGSVLSLPSFGRLGEPALLFSNPAHREQRQNLRLRLSRDGGQTWSKGVLIHPGPAAYSDLAPLPDGSIGCLYEGGTQHAYEGIHWQVLSAGEIERDEGGG